MALHKKVAKLMTHTLYSKHGAAATITFNFCLIN